jgi:hypothetical protein
VPSYRVAAYRGHANAQIMQEVYTGFFKHEAAADLDALGARTHTAESAAVRRRLTTRVSPAGAAALYGHGQRNNGVVAAHGGGALR